MKMAPHLPRWTIPIYLRMLRQVARVSFPPDSELGTVGCGSWELSSSEAHSILFLLKGPPKPSPRAPNDRGKHDFDLASEVVILDLRAEEDFSHMTLPTRSTSPLEKLKTHMRTH
ncbi:hypothetical protein FRC11_004514 [Ceratobasidium sp. 423]|nr:hypothetical protein FRC11_004514 [Ceratobasidium sp. 423]